MSGAEKDIIVFWAFVLPLGILIWIAVMVAIVGLLSSIIPSLTRRGSPRGFPGS